MVMWDSTAKVLDSQCVWSNQNLNAKAQHGHEVKVQGLHVGV